MKKDIPINILTELRENLRYRDELALKLGVSTYEYEQQKALYRQLIKTNLDGENRLKDQLHEVLDLSRSKNYRIDVDGGLVEEV